MTSGPHEQPVDPTLGGATRADAPGQEDPRSLGSILGDVSTDLSNLVRQEMELARTELKQEVAKAGKGAGMFGGAGIAALLMLGFLSAALMWLLDYWTPRSLAALIVGLIWAAVAAVLAMRGRQEIKEARPDLPATKESLKEDARWAKEQRSS